MSTGKRKLPKAVLAMRLRGLAAAPGVAVAPAILFDRRAVVLPRRPAGSIRVDQEIARLHTAIAASRERIGLVREGLEAADAAELGPVLDAHLLMHKDELLVTGAIALIKEGTDAEHAVRRVATTTSARLAAASSAYLAERARDVEHVGEAIVRELVGSGVELPTFKEPAILVAWDLAPAEMVRLPRELLRGIVTEQGSARSHTAFLARALRVPAVAGIEGLMHSVEQGEVVVVDGLRGEIVVSPPQAEETLAHERATRYQAFTGRLRDRQPTLGRTKCGTHVALMANVELEVEVEAAFAEHAEGIGLYRTEFLYLDGPPPDEDKLAEVFTRVARALAPRPTTLRTFDLGADKLPMANGPRTSGGALGLRGLRLALARPELFEAALRAMLRAAVDAPVRVMFPMVTTLGELKLATQMLESARRSLKKRRIPHGKVEVGAMIEVPSAALMVDAIAQEVDFLSVGTNDLTQYTLAVDRGDPRIAGLADPLDPAIVRLLRIISDGAEAAEIPVSICGDLAADPLAIPLLCGLGYRSLSMPATEIPMAREVLARLDVERTERVAAKALAATTAWEVRAALIEELKADLGEIWEEQGTLFTQG